jgi:hypothetical protein
MHQNKRKIKWRTMQVRPRNRHLTGFLPTIMRPLHQVKTAESNVLIRKEGWEADGHELRPSSQRVNAAVRSESAFFAGLSQTRVFAPVIARNA